MDVASLQGLSNLLSSTSMTSDVQGALSRLCHFFGCPSYLFFTGCVSVAGYLQGWTEIEGPRIIADPGVTPEKIKEMRSACKPLPALLRKSNMDLLPFFWEKDSVSQVPIELHNVLGAWIKSSAFVIPSYGPRAQFSFLILLCEKKEEQKFQEMRLQIKTLGPAVMAYLHVLLRPLRTIGPSLPISSRTLEIMEWTAMGKSSQEIAVILDLSHDTVDFQLKNIKRKLEASNKTHAIARLYHSDDPH